MPNEGYAGLFYPGKEKAPVCSADRGFLFES